MKSDILINDVDLKPRSEEDWAKIYSIELTKNDVLSASLMNEFEWAWRMMYELNYYPVEQNGTFDKAEQMEIRANDIITSILMNADPNEMKILRNQKRFIQTKYMAEYVANH